MSELATPLEIQPVEAPTDMRRFIRVPFRIQGDDPAWIPPLLVERRQALDRGRNPYFQHAEVAFWIARRDGRDVGRISAQIDRLAEPGTGFFGLLTAVDDGAVFASLLGRAEEWLRERGIRRIFGPFNLSINQEAGLLVDGFEAAPMLLMGHDPPYASRHLEALGYGKAKDLHAFIGDVERRQPLLAKQLARELPEGVVLRPLRMSDYHGEILTLTDIFNDAWRHNWGFVPFTPGEVDYLARQMRPLIEERLVWFTEVDGVAAAFAVCLPNLNEAIRDLGGRLLPFGWARLLWRLKGRGVRSARLPLMGVRRAYASTLLGSRLAFMLIGAIHRECAALGIKAIEVSWVLEDNAPIIRIIEALGGRRYKTYRLYEKAL
jgi:hypothetical protein